MNDFLFNKRNNADTEPDKTTVPILMSVLLPYSLDDNSHLGVMT